MRQKRLSRASLAGIALSAIMLVAVAYFAFGLIDRRVRESAYNEARVDC